MRALLMALVLAIPTLAHAEPTAMYVRAMPARVEIPAPREPKPVVLRLAMREPEENPLPETAERPEHPSLMERLRDRVIEVLPVVSTAVVAPLPISSADGTLAGLGVVGKF
ncbi:MAG: hypothetical protein AB7T06_04850 [Kofleriaceae bacterium]